MIISNPIFTRFFSPPDIPLINAFPTWNISIKKIVLYLQRGLIKEL